MIRFWAKVDKDGPIPAHRPELGPCWIWTGYITPGGYGNLTIGSRRDGSRRSILAHRLAYELTHGTIDRPQLDHLCRTRACVNPVHLEPVTNAQNCERSERATKTHCHAGHPFDEANTYFPPPRRDRPGQQRNARICRQCVRDSKERTGWYDRRAII